VDFKDAERVIDTKSKKKGRSEIFNPKMFEYLLGGVAQNSRNVFSSRKQGGQSKPAKVEKGEVGKAFATQKIGGRLA